MIKEKKKIQSTQKTEITWEATWGTLVSWKNKAKAKLVHSLQAKAHKLIMKVNRKKHLQNNKIEEQGITPSSKRAKISEHK
jgi:ABC-type antimicrobial peptide transport system ATPase subunit